MAIKSILVRALVDEAKHAHNCQHNARHRLQRGDRRLKVTENRADEHFCVSCALKTIERDKAKLDRLARQLKGDEQLDP